MTENEQFPKAEWDKYRKPDEDISFLPSFTGGDYLEEFEMHFQKCEETGDIRYYVYDPVEHGYDANQKYPVLVWFHGATNSLDGIRCITHSGAEMYASKSYQEKMGGAYVVVPLANEQTNEDGSPKWTEEGELLGSWSEAYVEPVADLIECVLERKNADCKKVFAAGGSSGGYFSWLMMERKMDLFCGGIPVSSQYIPADEVLEEFAKRNIQIIMTIGKHDEFVDYEKFILPRMDKLLSLDNIICYVPEWVYNGDGKIAYLFYGVQMGQHCMINQVQANLMFDDGTCYDDQLPNGVTGWIRTIVDEG